MSTKWEVAQVESYSLFEGKTSVKHHIDLPNGNRVYCPDNDTAARIVACVNACAGMDEPVAEIARLREIATTDPYPGVEGADE